MRHTQLEKLRAFSSNLIPSLEPLEMQMQFLNALSDSDKQLWHFARLLCTDADFIKNFGSNTFMRSLFFDSIQKKLDKKNAELAKIRSLRKKLAAREKVISGDIDTLQNQKVEAIFLQVKRKIKHENLNVSSGSILPLLEALRNHQQSSNDTNSVAEVDNQTKISLADSDKKTELDFKENLDSISKSPETPEELK